MITCTDMFCGAGGSSLGAAMAGARLELGLNHWRLAIDTHQENFPDAGHDCADVSMTDPRRYRRTTVLIASPECTNHSLAKGATRKRTEPNLLDDGDPAAERSRATMWDVVRFAEHHAYEAVIVENVVDARSWRLFPAWWAAMETLGYEGRTVYLNCDGRGGSTLKRDVILTSTPATEDAVRWDGWGTALKPAWESIVLARKPLVGTVARNVLEHGTGALNIDACRTMHHEPPGKPSVGMHGRRGGIMGETVERVRETTAASVSGRWPANVVLDERAAELLDAQSGTLTSGSRAEGVRTGLGYHGADGDGGPAIEASSGGASRFFYTSKASRHDRGPGNKHPTVKPTELMRWLVRLVTPPDGTVLDPFAGSGTTGVACIIEGFGCVLVERDAEYVDIIRERLSQPIEPVLDFTGGDAA